MKSQKKKINAKAVSSQGALMAKFFTPTYIAAAGVVALVLTMGGTAYAANGAKPGDTLYSMDRALEGVQSMLALSPQSQADLSLSLATERVEEAQAVMQEEDFDSADLNTALDGLAAQKKNLADLVAAEAALKQQAKAYEDKFEAREKALDTSFKDAGERLRVQKKQLKAQLEEAETANNADKAAGLIVAIAAIENQLRGLEAEEEAAEKSLEAEEKRLEAKFEAREKALEAEEEAREDGVKQLEDQAEAAREKAEDAQNDEKEQLEKEAEAAEAAAKRAREAGNEQERQEASENGESEPPQAESR